jgi:hypothetical protein
MIARAVTELVLRRETLRMYLVFAGEITSRPLKRTVLRCASESTGDVRPHRSHAAAVRMGGFFFCHGLCCGEGHEIRLAEDNFVRGLAYSEKCNDGGIVCV